VCLDLGTSKSPFLVFANLGTPQFLFGVEGEVDRGVLSAIFAVLDAMDSSREAAVVSLPEALSIVRAGCSGMGTEADPTPALDGCSRTGQGSGLQ